MKLKDPDLNTPSLLLLDDENQIHSSVRLRLGDNYRLVDAFDPKEALTLIAREPLDLCLVDIQMPGMDGLTFIEAARKIDPALSYVILSGFDSDENLRRAIPLQVLEFLSKPLPDRSRFERVLPEWIEHTRTRRKELTLAENSATLVRDIELARIRKLLDRHRRQRLAKRGYTLVEKRAATKTLTLTNSPSSFNRNREAATEIRG